MDGMARSCGADIPDAEGGPQAHAGILQNDGGSVKPRRVVGAVGVNSESSGTCAIRSSTFGVRRSENLELRTSNPRPACQSRVSRSSRYPPDGATTVKRIAPIRLISLICSPT
jgi:hypothetical protein